VQIGSFGRVLQRVHRAGCLVGAGHRTAPAAWADRLDGALAQLLDRGGVVHGDRCPSGERPGSWPSASRRARAREVTSLAGSLVSRVPPPRWRRRAWPRSPSPGRPAPPGAPRGRRPPGRLGP